MNSELALRDLDTGEEMVFRIVFPSEANADQHRISVLAPLCQKYVVSANQIARMVEYNIQVEPR